jgi:hydrogenase nickel incorporation protein HypA/HybF
MHEASIVQGLMSILAAKASEHGVDRIVAVQLKIGRLRGIDSRQIRSCFEIFAEGTAAEGASLDIVEIAPEAKCRACGRSYEVQRYRFECPACGGTDADVVKGRELYVESFTCRGEPDDGAGSGTPEGA